MKNIPKAWRAYEKRVRELEEEGLDRSDAQGVADAEDARAVREGRRPLAPVL